MRKLIIALLTGLLTLSGCASVEATSANVTVSSFYNQTLTWKSCGTKLKCSTVNVPIDYAHPANGSIKISINWLASTGSADLGWLLENPGGPGGSGIDFVAGGGDQVGSIELRKHYNVVGFDPRGIQRSAPIKCYNAKDTDHLLYDDFGPAGSAQELANTRVEMKKFIAACQKNSGKIFGFVDTVSAAKDLDVIRSALGSKKLNYLGFSYGTFLGTTYAALFPKNVGRMVLDGAMDPSVSDEQQSLNQLKAFNQALRNYLADCLSKSSCQFSGSVDSSMTKITNLFKSLETKPLETSDGRKLNAESGITGLIMTLYSNDYWQYLDQAFEGAFKGDGTTFMRLADFYNDRNQDGSYASNAFEANIAVSCLDSRADSSAKALEAQNAKVLAASPFLGRYWLNGAVGCEQWPFPIAKKPASYSAKGSGAIVVVGTTGDPATPYWQSQNLANKILSSGHLVTFNGEGHTAYGRSNSCIVKAVDDYLVRGAVPLKDPNC
jgi:pimeloyl-ACP methyl ester carboxylesterase